MCGFGALLLNTSSLTGYPWSRVLDVPAFYDAVQPLIKKLSVAAASKGGKASASFRGLSMSDLLHLQSLLKKHAQPDSRLKMAADLISEDSIQHV